MDASRTELLIGRKGVERLAAARVIVVGLGGVGGYIAEALARAGIGAIDLVDPDVVSHSNANRQILALSSTVGRFKADVAAERIREIDPECRVTPYRLFVTEETIDRLPLAECDFAADAIDTVASKAALAAACAKLGVPIVSCLGSGNKLHADFRIADLYETKVCPLARAMRAACRKRGIDSLPVVYSESEPLGGVTEEGGRRTPGSISYVPAQAGLKCAEYIVTTLLEKER